MTNARILEVLQEHLVAPLSCDRHVTGIYARADREGWDVYVLVDMHRPEIVLPVAEQVGRCYDAIHSDAYPALMDIQVRERSIDLERSLNTTYRCYGCLGPPDGLGDSTILSLWDPYVIVDCAAV